MAGRRRNWLTSAQHAAGIRTLWPEQPNPTVSPDQLRWKGSLQPTALSPAYTVVLTYRTGNPPHVYVTEPTLDPGHREALPHVYEGERLCLYTPGEWRPTMPIARTILPWTADWLFHYEIWRATDRWVGGGHVHAPEDESDAERAIWERAS